MFKLLIIKIIKLLSPILMLGFLVLDSDFIYLYFNHREIPSLVKILTIMGTLILIIHLMEAIIAGFLAKDKEENPLNYGIYTFFIGTIGLFELLEKENKSSDNIKLL